MHVRAPAILVAARQHGETAVVARLLTEEFGLVAGYVAGGRGRQLRPVVIPGNAVDLQLSARSESQLPFARLELTQSRGPWLTEPLPAAAIGWITALTAAVLPERQPYPALFAALSATLDAICHAPSARGWAGAVAGYERLFLRELGFGGTAQRPLDAVDAIVDQMRALEPKIERHLFGDRRTDIIAARRRLLDLLSRLT